MSTNTERVANAEAQLQLLDTESNGEREALVDFLTGLAHSRGTKWLDASVEMARMHCREEIASESARPRKPRTLNERTWNLDQSWHFARTVATDAGKLRVSIRRNAYDFQSWAKVARWDGSEWQAVHSMPIEACACASVSYVDRDLAIVEAAFRIDAEELLRIALEIVS